MSVAGKKDRYRKTNKKIAATVILLAVFVSVALLHLLGVFVHLENRSYDMRVRFFAPYMRPSHDIVVVLVNQDSIDWVQRERGWPWPWPRTAYAEIIEFLGEAASVTFDIIFSEPSIHRNGDDADFAR
ncbi:MAG: CHASE2 domain-containing protein, partial [Treponema sp.]|nr:CHASE2 domain-containing protein [Treponema sp.]